MGELQLSTASAGGTGAKSTKSYNRWGANR